jgi:hypothetical protein
MSSFFYPDDAIPPLIQPGEEQLPPMPDAAYREYSSNEAIAHRQHVHSLHSLTWHSECPEAMANICCVFAGVIERALEREPQWMDAFGEMHITTPASEKQAASTSQGAGERRSNSFWAVSEILKA